MRGGVDLAVKKRLANQTYVSDYSSKQEAKEAGLAINEQIAEEGMVLLKNENNTLPLKTRSGSEATRVTLFGYASYAPAGGAEGGGDSSAGSVHLTSDIYSSLRDDGYITNPSIRSFYETEAAASKTTDFTTVDDLKNNTSLAATYNSYGDAAIVVFSTGDVTDTTITHKYQLDSKQKDLLTYVKQRFDKVIVLINNSVPLELGDLKDDAAIDAILVVGQPGDNGFDAGGKILNGEVNPSARLVDTYARDLTSAPSYNNYSAGVKKAEVADLTGGSGDYLKYIVDGKEVNTYLSVYEEGIYVGYRYYETVASIDGNDDWYDETVAYPFGYGLSYTDFSYQVTPRTVAGDTIDQTDTLTFDIAVTNTGNVAGKDVLELYYSAPYTTGGIEKSSVVLGDFTKTDLLQPGETETYTVSIDVRDMASYDYKTEKTYVLDAGTYNISLRSDAHTVIDGQNFNYTVAEKELVDESRSGTEVTNRFDDVNSWMDENDENLSRTDFANKTAAERKQLTTKPTDAERTLTAQEYEAWNGDIDSAEDDTDKPWSIPATTQVTYAESASARPATAEVTLDQLVGKDYDDPLWDDLISQLTLEELENLINNGGFRTISLDYIGKPYSMDTDGPKGWTGNGIAGTTFNAYAAEPVIASTWNKELAYEMGRNVADQGLWGNSDRTDEADGGKVNAYTGWYAPAMNIHRSPFDGRYTEYYSEDPLLSGMMAANASLGAKSKGAYVFIKHFALHDDGAGVAGSYDVATGSFAITGYRGSKEKESGLSVWCNEQAMREIYFKPFQLAVEVGGATAAMSAFNRLGTTWAGGNYALLTQILREEWGFRGFVVTDISIYGFLNVDQMIRAGGDAVLNSGGSLTLYASDYTASNPTIQVYYMQQAAHNILYTVANSNAMNIPLGASVYYAAPETGLADAVVGTAYTGDISSAELNTVHNYVNPNSITYALTSGTLPAGLTLNSDGTISGTPTASGTFTFTVTASVEGYASDSRTFTIQVREAPVVPEVDSDDISSIQGDIADLEGSISDLDSKLDDLGTKVDAIPGQGLAIGALITGIIGIVVGAAAIVLHFFKKN